MSPVKFVKEGRSNAASVKQEKNPPISELLKMEPNTNVSSATLPVQETKSPETATEASSQNEAFNPNTYGEGKFVKRMRMCSSAKEEEDKCKSPKESVNLKRTKSPKSAWSKSKKIMRCLICQEKGHGLKDCPKVKLEPCCYKCGATDHFARACSIKEDVQTFAVCFICNEKGHLGKSCPSKIHIQTSASSHASSSDAAQLEPITVDEQKSAKKEKKGKTIQKSASSRASSCDAAQLEPITVEEQKSAKKEKKDKIVQTSASSHATSSDAAQPEPMMVEEEKPVKREKKDKRESMNNKQMAKRNEARFKKIREELIASGKSREEIEREFMGVQRSILKKAYFIRCHLCQERGHGQKNCPLNEGTLKCHRCGKSGHFSRNCTIKEEVHTFAVCFLCRQMGHMGKFCPNNPEGRTAPCYNCNQTTHLQKDCPIPSTVD